MIVKIKEGWKELSLYELSRGLEEKGFKTEFKNNILTVVPYTSLSFLLKSNFTAFVVRRFTVTAEKDQLFVSFFTNWYVVFICGIFLLGSIVGSYLDGAMAKETFFNLVMLSFISVPVFYLIVTLTLQSTFKKTIVQEYIRS
jgi:biotin transporter BioY